MPRILKKDLLEEIKRLDNKLYETQNALLESIVTKEGRLEEIPCGHSIIQAKVIDEKCIIFCECTTYTLDYRAPFVLTSQSKVCNKNLSDYNSLNS